MIRARGLDLAYRGRTVLRDVDLEVAAGEVTGLLGGNGAGKSTTLRAIAGVLPPKSGELRVAGFDMRDVRQAETARGRIGYCPDTGGLVRACTVREHIGLALALHEATDQWPQAMELVEEFDLLGVFEAQTASFSHGMSRRLSVLMAVLTASDVLVLDEPFDGVDPSGVRPTLAAVRRAAAAGTAVIVSTHLLELLTQVSDRILVLAAGRVADAGSAEDFSGPAGRTRYQTSLGMTATATPAGERVIDLRTGAAARTSAARAETQMP